MKFSEKVEEIKNQKENKGKIVIVRCGIFFIATGNDAIFLNKLLGLNVSCFKEGVCKIGIPYNSILKYVDILEEYGYSYVLYDYEKDTKILAPKFAYIGKTNPETDTCKNCKECPHYTVSPKYRNINIYEILEQRKTNKNEQ